MQTKLAGFAGCQECRKARRSRMVLDNLRKLLNHHAAKKRKLSSLKKCKQRDLFQQITSAGIGMATTFAAPIRANAWMRLIAIWRFARAMAGVSSGLGGAGDREGSLKSRLTFSGCLFWMD